jgi:hypothetical protein
MHSHLQQQGGGGICLLYDVIQLAAGGGGLCATYSFNSLGTIEISMLWTSSDVTGSLDVGGFSCFGTPDLN